MSDSGILIVDNDNLIRGMLEDVLRTEGYAVLTAETGERALQMAASRLFDAFVLDVKAPGITGIELCRQLRLMPQHRATPILVVMGADAYAPLTAAFAAGCDDFICKPLNPIELRARLRGLLTRMEYFRQLDRTRRMLNQYLSKRTLQVVESVARTGLLPPPEERELTVLFTDIRGFTALSEDENSSHLFDLVSAALSEQVDRVHEYGGYVDKFGGDGLMAIFDGQDMVAQCCRCALRMVEAADVDWGIGIGIHTGRAIIGNIGSPEHLDYSAVGMTVNLAARLCGQADATSIVVSKSVRDAAENDPSLYFHSERTAVIKGIKAPMTIFTLSREGQKE